MRIPEYKALNQWIDAVHSQNPDTVVNCYAQTAVLLPTVSNQLRYTQKERHDYFVSFLAKKPKCRVISLMINSVSHDVDVLSGTYAFSFEDNQQVTARFSYVYQNGLITQHHSSLMPEN